MAKTKPFHPPFKIPLTKAQLESLGRISAVWAQVEMALDHFVNNIYGLNNGQRDILLGERMVGSKLGIVQQSLKFIPDEDKRALAKQFTDQVSNVIGKRNHAAHGLWAWRVTDDATRTKFIGARSNRSPDKPIKATDLADIEKKIVECARAGYKMMLALDGLPYGDYAPDFKPGDLYFGAQKEPPKWIPKAKRQPR